jgi:biotin synthase-like enzyme
MFVKKLFISVFLSVAALGAVASPAQQERHNFCVAVMSVHESAGQMADNGATVMEFFQGLLQLKQVLEMRGFTDEQVSTVIDAAVDGYNHQKTQEEIYKQCVTRSEV